MIIMPTILILVFIYLSTQQLNEFKSSINSYRNGPAAGDIPSPWDTSGKFVSLQNNLDYIKWYSRVKLEDKAIDHRYAQSGFLLIARTYSKYLGFFTGMILAIVAAVFIISKLKEDVSQLEGSIREKIRFRVVSSSPGVIFGLLGTVLMLSTILYNPEIAQTDTPLYMVPDISIQGNPAPAQNTAAPKGQIPADEIRSLDPGDQKDSPHSKRP
ncbi:hypothetical protein GCM10011511_25390 [Puia dinghuensis]|uniref:Uncharacterized protein n=2 Tax=Puia dinghuensis TaxID=1792502 RepID=A0A8J2UD41_9BACT|nr:hypothetical protein GCM10011511_25390 [Puia dinghuensis]